MGKYGFPFANGKNMDSHLQMRKIWIPICKWKKYGFYLQMRFCHLQMDSICKWVSELQIDLQMDSICKCVSAICKSNSAFLSKIPHLNPADRRTDGHAGRSARQPTGQSTLFGRSKLFIRLEPAASSAPCLLSLSPQSPHDQSRALALSSSSCLKLEIEP